MTHKLQAGAVLMDPPYPGYGGGYETLSRRRLLKFPLDHFTAPDSHLYLWVPNGMVADGVKLAENFGYTVRNVITWVKSRPGRPTRYLQANTELLLFCTRGDAPVKVRGQQTVMFAPTQLHSQKPDEQYAIIERLSEPPFLELFARTSARSKDWKAWGLELEDSDITVEGFPVSADFLKEAA